MPPPRPPSVNAGRTIAGRPIWAAKDWASSGVVAIADSGIFSPARSIASRKRSRSSAQLIAS